MKVFSQVASENIVKSLTLIKSEKKYKLAKHLALDKYVSC